jgi:hypothetical protein
MRWYLVRRLNRFSGQHKEAAMPSILDIQEHGIDGDGHQGEKYHLKRRERRPRSRARVIGHDQTEHGQRQDHHEKGIGAVEIVVLFAKAQTAKQQGETNEPIEHQHDHRKHRIAGKGRLFHTRGHHEGDHCHLQPGNGESQQQGPQRLSQPMSEDLSVAHYGDCRREDDAANDQQKHDQQHRPVQRSGGPAFAHQRQHER